MSGFRADFDLPALAEICLTIVLLYLTISYRVLP